MPNAADYAEAELDLSRLGSQFLLEADLLAGWRIDQIGCGPAVDALAEHLAVVVARLRSVSGQLVHIGNVCEARAAVCRVYARRVAEWEATIPEHLMATPCPQPPAEWVSV